MRALRLVVSIGNHAARGCVSSGGLQSSRAWAAAAGGGFGAVGRGSLVVSHAMYHKRNPYDFRVVRDEDDAELASLSNLDESIDEVDEQRKKVVRGVEAAKTAALKLLAARSHSRKELKAKLLERGYELDDVRAALDRLESVGLQSDAEFAEVFARSKWRQSKWGSRRIESELHHRGISTELAAAAIRSVFGEGLDVRQHLERLEDDDSDGQRGTPEQVLLEKVRGQWSRMAGLSEEARRRRFVAWMQRRGHQWEDTRHLLRQLEKEEAQRAIDGDEAEV
ncbi:hypothetical protein D9Q98_005046 [Chlorella vulgaris]|uniref:Regulatory protein RecX n=1 Tax=Chlorella vulgaris TaxID=3077 RepID=A0A9D4YWK4_CHLVU|nr:hypothetical protein D9Q98_005046 [Chlorella vulgaris]